MDILSQLNPSQREAVLYNDGPSLIIAGAGSGKTRVLTYKIAYLLQQGVPANRILALTFTNKAAREMKARIQALVGESEAKYLWMGTFHSICARILRLEAEKLSYTRDFTIYDNTDSKSVIKQICKEQQLDDKIYKSSLVLSRISSAKNSLMTAAEYAANADIAKRDRFDRLYDMAEVYRLYELRLKQSNALDFDDLLMRTCQLFRQHPDALHYYQQIFQHILVDEYQDTNYAQYLIVKMLAEPENHISVVGDDAQSIYSFRGADIRNILGFQNGYPNTRLFKLERNYRSTQNIVRAANSLIHHNENQIYKEVYSENSEGDRLTLTSYMTDREEAQGVAKDIHTHLVLHKKKDITLDDVAILYRTNAQSRAFENELRRLNIPYRIYGSTSFYQRKEIKDAICYFRLAANPLDTEAFIRSINFPSRGIGDITLRRIAECAAAKGMSHFDVVSRPVAAGLPASVNIMKRLKEYAELIKRFHEAMDTMDAYEVATMVLKESGIMSSLEKDTTPEGIDRKENVEELLTGIHDFVLQRKEEGIDFTPIQDFLSEVSLQTDQDEHLSDHTSRVTLMTVHAAKGLEFKKIYIVGLEENLFPSQFSSSVTELEEERRLLYVAITRAMVECHLTYARQRFKNGSTNPSLPSRFLKDIDRQFLLVHDGLTAPLKKPLQQSLTSQPTRPQQSATGGRLISLSATKSTGATPLTAEQSGGFFPDDRIRHRTFGEGTILRIYRENDNDKVDIQFDTVGKKTLLLTYAKLEKI